MGQGFLLLVSMTIRETLAEGTRLLKSTCRIDSPALDAALLLGKVLGRDRAGLLTHAPEPVSEEKRREYAALLERRLGGECTAYILGRREFRGLDFAITPAVLVPRPDTETLVEAALDWLDGRQGSGGRFSVLELCTGSGAAAIALKHERPGLSIAASDISPPALALARENAARLLTGEAPPPLAFFQSDLFENIPGAFDLILANPPYVPSPRIAALPPEVRGEPLLALDGGEDGLDLIRRIIREAPARLRPGGALFLEADPGQMGAITELLGAEGFRAIGRRKDLAGRDRVVGGVIS
jgi:release factor glutamine methyltransferase